MRELVITAVGPDRPGLIGKLTAPLYEGSANVADSRMVNLRGQFALMLLAEIPSENLEQVQKHLAAVADQLGLTLTVRSSEPALARPTTVGVPYRVHTYAMDQPGLVYRITDLLQRHGINVEELTTRSQPRPESGAPLFSMELLVTVPASIPIRHVRAELERLCEELNCDVELAQAKPR
ncbi:MAG: Glycine cleavage system transcriptional antiactivator GcvR [Myxococcaceae bacterium]|nr:Glycine cleavage system transcriptional antiactivator GcvR [Myxococcaceae bacterium]